MTEAFARVESDRRQSLCPICVTLRGVPISNTVGHGMQTLTLQCPTCAHTWSYVRLEAQESTAPSPCLDTDVKASA